MHTYMEHGGARTREVSFSGRRRQGMDDWEKRGRIGRIGMAEQYLWFYYCHAFVFHFLFFIMFIFSFSNKYLKNIFVKELITDLRNCVFRSHILTSMHADDCGQVVNQMSDNHQ